MHGGNIWVESRFGHGSRFTFTLPRKKSTAEKTAEAERAQVHESGFPFGAQERSAFPIVSDPVEFHFPRKPDTAAEGDKPAILVVEDDPQVSQLLNQYLTQEGYDVFHATHGGEVLEKAKACKPFAITLDVMLPGKDGWEVIQELKQTPETQNIPVIIVSIVSNRELGFSLGASDYLTKPIDKKTLLESLRKQSLTTHRRRKPVTILVVDDDPAIVDLMAEFLEKDGYGVIKAYGGQQGSDLAIEMQPDLIVLDLMMPQVSGFDVITRLKSHPTAKNIPVVICTAKHLTPEEKETLMRQSRHIVAKGGPIKDQLLHEVHKMERLYPDKARMVDGLTGLPNHKYFQNCLSDEVEKARRYRKPFSLLMTNVDGFTTYNEQWGIREGDKVLTGISDLLRTNIRAANSLARYGGSTFTVILSDTTKQSALMMGERIKKILEEHPLSNTEGSPGGKLTISIGIATFFEDSETGDGLIRIAEEALEQARRTGGNRVIAPGGTVDNPS
jgi:diguanylate cyclase (GGDEF)-like protein